MMSFDLGQLVATRQVDADMKVNPQFHNDIIKALYRYMSCDFSYMKNQEDIQMNIDAIKNGNDRIFGVYPTILGDIWIITEWDRSVTTILYPSEY